MTLDIGLAARVIAAIRTHTSQRTGCPEWDTPGIAKAIGATIGSPGDVLAAAAIAAEDPKLAKPSATAFTARWHSKASEPPRVSHDVPCPDHPGRVMPCDLCREGKRPPTPDELAAARDAIQAAKDDYHARMQQLRGELGSVR